MFESSSLHTRPEGRGPTKPRDELSLIKCKRCRKDKKKCEPTNRHWPERCKRCEEDNKACSKPMTAKGEHDAEMNKYRILKDIVTVVRLHRLEELALRKQESHLWYNHIPWSRLKGGYGLSFETVQVITTAFSEYLKTLLTSTNLSAAERLLLCQLAADLETPLITSPIGASRAEFYKATNGIKIRQGLADSLSELGDDSGALVLWHETIIHGSPIGPREVKALAHSRSNIQSRLPQSSKYLGMPLSSDACQYLGDLDVLMLPYSMHPSHEYHKFGSEEFVKMSFMWPWVRRRIAREATSRQIWLGRALLAFDLPLEEALLIPREGDHNTTDAFGHSLLHAAVLSRDAEHTAGVVKSMEAWEPSSRSAVLTLSPSGAVGYTALSCATLMHVTSGPERKIFATVLSASGVQICSIPDEEASHRYCPLKMTFHHGKDGQAEIMRALLGRLDETNEDIRTCVKWAKRNAYLGDLETAGATRYNTLKRKLYLMASDDENSSYDDEESSHDDESS